MARVLFVVVVLVAVAVAVPDDERRRPRIFNLLQVVRFQNDPCMGSGNLNGTCYTEAECQSRGGVNSASCADGFGVCCVFTLGCGEMSSENCTFFSVNGVDAGACTATICPCGNNICQIRLDFIDFVISGPSTTSTSQFRTLNGAPTTGAGGVKSTQASNCLVDTFSVTSPGGASVPPTICGTNIGDHMYVDSSDSCNDLTFQLGAAGTVARDWNIKVTQFGCGFGNLAPPGCTQYFFGSATGTARSYNFAGGQHLANQNQAICVRRENGNCRLCFTNDMATFDISGRKNNTRGNRTPVLSVRDRSMCCNYGMNGDGTMGFDCVSLPGAVGGNNGNEQKDRLCGRAFPATRCTLIEPFMLRFISDGVEFVSSDPAAAIDEAAVLDDGFSLNFFMDSINCNVFEA